MLCGLIWVCFLNRWLTGIVEVQLPVDFRIQNIQETELAKEAVLQAS